VEYTDLSQMAHEFVAEATRGVLEKMGEFATSLRDRLNGSGLSERNLEPIRRWVESMREAVSVFKNERLDAMLRDLEGFSGEGITEDLSISKRLRDSMDEAMGGIIRAANEEVDIIAQQSVEALTSQKRRIEK
jgi:hypothetical protein